MRPELFPNTHNGSSNFVELLRFRAQHQADETVFTYLADGEENELNITFSQLDQQARAIGAWLESKGLVGERALLLYPAGLDFIAAYFGCLYAGVVAVPAYPPRRNRKLDRIEAIVKDCDAQVALVTASVLEQISTVIDETPSLSGLNWLATDQLSDEWQHRWQPPPINGETLAFLQYTSGSTGVPKGVMLTHANLMHNSALIHYSFELTRSGTGVFWLPSYHDMGLIGGVLLPLFVGRPNILMSPMAFLLKPVRWLRAIMRYRGITAGGPNFAYDLCVDKVTEKQKEGLDLSCWEVAFSGAEPVRPETLDRFAKAFAPCGFRREAFYPCYGLAEGTLLSSGGFKLAGPMVRAFEATALEQDRAVLAEDEDAARRMVGCGGAFLDQKVVIADPNSGEALPEGRVGEIWVSGPSIARGYWRRPEDTEFTFGARIAGTDDGPFLRTGDLGFMHENELFVTGRIKDLIIIRGVNHYPQDIELTIQQCHPRIHTGAVAAFTTESEGQQRLVIVAEIGRRAEELADEIIEEIKRTVAAGHHIQANAVVLLKKGIPKTSSGKIQRHACRDAFQKDTFAAVIASWRDWEPLEPSGNQHTATKSSTETSTPQAAGPNTTGKNAPSNGAPLRAVRGDTLEVVAEHVRRIAKQRAARMTPDTSIVDLGLDSLERMEIVASLEESYGGRFPEQVLASMETCREVAAAVEKYLGSEHHQRIGIPADEEIPPAYYEFDRFPEYRQLREIFDQMKGTGLKNPYFTVHEGLTSDTTVVDGRELVSFSTYNYLGMSGDPALNEAAKKAVDRFGTSVTASRLVSGEKTIHGELEQAISSFLSVPDAITFVSGHGTNETTIGHLFGPGDLILHDGLAHNSIVQGAILSGARRRAFPHNDWKALDTILGEVRRHYRRVLVAIEGIYSMDGDFPDLPRFIDVKKRHRALLYVDEAHSLGVMGLHGRGIGEHFEVDPADVDVWMGTLSKGLGSSGGYIAGCKPLVEYLRYTAPGFVFSNGLAPPAAAAALAALKLLEEEPDRVARLGDRARLFLELAQSRGLDTGVASGTPVVPIILGSSPLALGLSQAMRDRGVNVQPILHPAVEESAVRLRFFITCLHSEQQIRTTVDILAEELAKLDPGYLDRAPERQSRRPKELRVES